MVSSLTHWKLLFLLMAASTNCAAIQNALPSEGAVATKPTTPDSKVNQTSISGAGPVIGALQTGMPSNGTNIHGQPVTESCVEAYRATFMKTLAVTDAVQSLVNATGSIPVVSYPS